MLQRRGSPENIEECPKRKCILFPEVSLRFSMEAETLDIALVFKSGMWSPFKTVYLQMSKASLGKVQSGQVGSVTCDEIPN